MRAKFIPGISIELCSNGQALREYQDEDTIDGENLTATRYVEAVPNTAFSVHMQVDSDFLYKKDDLDLGIEIDGQEITRHAMRARPELRGLHVKVHCAGVDIKGVRHKQLFTFGELKTTDEPLDKSQDPISKDILSALGEVTVCLKRGKIVGENGHRDIPSKFQSKLGESVPEKALKGRSISTRVTLKDSGTYQLNGTYRMGFPHGQHSFAKFTFKYRSHRDLQIEGIIARSPSPEPFKDLDLDNMTREEAVEALHQQRAQAAPTARIKRERGAILVIDLSEGEEDDDDDEEGDGVSVIAAGPVKKRQRMSNDSGIDIIDLTDD